MKHLILVVEDDPDFRELMKAALEEADYQVLLAGNGEEALDLLSIQTPAVIITDIVMPRKDGIELIRTLTTEAPDAKLIAMSGGGVLGHQDYYMELSRVMGVQGTLTKPFKIKELLELVEKVIAS